MKGIILIGLVFLVGCNPYPGYVERNGDVACEICFDEGMKSYFGGKAWSEITCTGEHNKLVLRFDDKPDDADCFEPDLDCREETKYLHYTNLWDYDCSEIEKMIDLNIYPNVEKKYHALGCYSNKSNFVEGSDTAECRDCAEQEWKGYYLDNCIKKSSEAGK